MTLVDIMKNIRKQVESKSKVTISSDNGWILLAEIDRLIIANKQLSDTCDGQADYIRQLKDKLKGYRED